MFNVLEGGVSEPINWGKENLSNDRSIIILDESSQVVWLWHGSMQGLVARRTALRQAESLKGHGFTVGKSIIGRDLKGIREIDQRKLGRDPASDELYSELEKVLNREVNELDNHVVTFELTEKELTPVKEVKKETVVSETVQKTKPEPIKLEAIKEPPIKTSKPDIKPATEYDLKPETPKPVTTTLEQKRITSPTVKVPKLNLNLEAKIGFVLVGIMQHYEDIWVSKKEDNSYSVEMMDGPICSFKVTEGSKISFSPDSFKGISTNLKTEIQKKFVELSKLIS